MGGGGGGGGWGGGHGGVLVVAPWGTPLGHLYIKIHSLKNEHLSRKYVNIRSLSRNVV